MAKFNYKFASIQKVKESFEKKAQKELAQINLEIHKKDEEIILLLQEGSKHKDDPSNRSIKINELKFHQEFQRQIKVRIELIQKDIFKLEEKKAVKLQELILKSKENKIFKKLEEKHKEIFMMNENKIDSITIDEVAGQKFSRGNK